jgi:hypothetical protein
MIEQRVQETVFGWAIGCAVLLTAASHNVWACGENPYWKKTPSSPTGQISSPSGSRWDHVNDTRDYVELEVTSLEDKDTFHWPDGHETLHTNYIVSSGTYWQSNEDRGYCYPTTGTTTHWYATHTGTGAWVKAWLVDQPYNTNFVTHQPDYGANDPDIALTYSNLQGFAVGVRPNASGAWSIGNPETVWEGGSGTWSSESNVSHHLEWSNGDSALSVADYLYAQFEYKTDPPEATPAGDVTATVGFGLTALWNAAVNDNDAWDGAGDSVSVGGSLGYILGFNISYTWTLADPEECIAVGDWAYTTDTGLGTTRIPSGSPLWQIESGSDPEGVPKTYGGSQTLARSACKTWDKSCPVRGQFDVCGGINGGPDPSAWGWNYMTLLDGWVSVSGVGYSP